MSADISWKYRTHWITTKGTPAISFGLEHTRVHDVVSQYSAVVTEEEVQIHSPGDKHVATLTREEVMYIVQAWGVLDAARSLPRIELAVQSYSERESKRA